MLAEFMFFHPNYKLIVVSSAFFFVFLIDPYFRMHVEPNYYYLCSICMSSKKKTMQNPIRDTNDRLI